MATDPTGEWDLAVVGGGIVGLAVARELQRRHPDRTLVVLERERELAMHQTGHSSGVVHAGIYYSPGSLKARLCVEGARLLSEYCAERGLPFERSGKLIVATREDELARLDDLERRGRANGVAGLARLGPEGIAELEPQVRGIAALHSPATAVIDFAAVARSLADQLRSAGATIATGCAVEGAVVRRGWLHLRHGTGETRTRFAVFCAGLWADRLAVGAGAERDPRIVPFRGAYMKLCPERRGLVRANVYPVPNPGLPFLGMHLTRTLDGEVMLGPSALLAGARDAYRLRRVRARDLRETLTWPGTWRMARRHWRAGLGELHRATSLRAFVRALARYLPELTPGDVEPGPAGVRAQALARDGTLLDDFALSRTERALHVRNAPSPAATSALALARLIVDEVEREL